jgi:membrane-bound metal-dependent hydrolase YbcI (DUF457 family)
MTVIGHTLTGLAFCMASLPSSPSRARCGIQLGIFVLLANIPDIPLPYWGHARYDISHSIFVNLLLSLLILLSLSWLGGYRDLRLSSFGMAAWFSHLLLDAFYNHGNGVGIFWPFSSATLALPVPWFSALTPVWPPTAQEISIGLIEFMSYVPLVVITLLFRRGARLPAQRLEFVPMHKANSTSKCTTRGLT